VTNTRPSTGPVLEACVRIMLEARVVSANSALLYIQNWPIYDFKDSKACLKLLTALFNKQLMNK
jgi:hypothetical protein